MRLLLRLFGILVLLAGSVLEMTRAETPPYECVAFIAVGSQQIYRFCPNDGTPQILGKGAFGNRALALSPDEKWLVVIKDDENRNCCVLARMDVDGKSFQELARARGMLIHAWSPNGQWIAFYAEPAGVYLVRPDGSELHPLTNDPALSWAKTQTRRTGNLMIAWSPDSEWIALSVVNCSDDLGYTSCSSDVYRVRADGSAFQRLTTGLADEFWPVWSPDGQWIAYATRYTEYYPQEDIFVMRSNGSEARRLTVPPEDSYIQNFWPIWSSDSQWILFTRGEEHAWWSTLYRVSAKGGEPQKVGEKGLLLSGLPVSSPDRNWILSSGVLVDVEGGAYKIRSDGSDVELLIRNPGPGGYPGYQWLPTPAKPWRGGMPLALGGLMVALSFSQSAFIRVHLRPILKRKTP